MKLLKERVLITAALMFGTLVGVVLTKQFGNYADSCQIKYISQDELMALEQERVKGDPVESRQLFFGQAGLAAKLATSLPKAFEDSTTLMVYSTGPVSGKNVKSISKEVHQNIIAKLAKEKDE